MDDVKRPSPISKTCTQMSRDLMTTHVTVSKALTKDNNHYY